jgi:putative drug exporter of the RND superfamily
VSIRGALAASVAVLVGCVVLGILGLGVEGKLDPLSLKVPGTAVEKGEALAEAHFGDSAPFAVLLRGPAQAIDRQGPELVRALRRESGATVISPWDRGSVAGLRPGPGRTLILVDFHVSLDEAIRDTVPALEGALDRQVHAPVLATQSGFADVSRAIQQESLRTTERAELLAAPLLILVLLLVFRSVFAAAIPLVLGALTVLAGRGVLDLLSSVMTIDSLALVVCTMMGLALGVDYSLLIVSRFREELREGGSPLEAALRTRASAGRTAVFAGSTFLVAIVLSAFLQPGSLLLSIAVAAAVVTAISVVIAVAALPGLLALLGSRVNALPIGRSGTNPGRSSIAAFASSALRRPALAALLIAIPLALLAAPALAFRTGAPGIDELPASNQARRDAEVIDRAIGPGWEAPFVLVAATESGPITTERRLALLGRWQRRIAAQPGVRAVIGPAPLAHRAAPLRRLGERLTASGPKGAQQLTRLGPGLRRAATSVSQLRDGLARAAAGSGLLGEGAGRAQQGAGLIADGLGHAATGGQRAGAAVSRLAEGSKKLGDAQRRTAVGSLTLQLGLHSLLPQVRGNSLARARSLATALASAAGKDPSLRPQARRARTLARAIAIQRDELRRLRGIADRVNGGLNRIVGGGRRLESGVGRLASAAEGLNGGLGRLGSGADRLAAGLAELEGGAGTLKRNLAEGFHRSRPLEVGLRRTGVRVSSTVTPLSRGARELQRESPHLFDSGYFVLSALDGASPVRRALASEAVDVGGGGQAARMLVISTHAFNTAGSEAVGRRLQADVERIGQQGRLQTGLTGGAATLNDYGAVTRERIPLVIAAVILITFLMLVALLRAPLLAAIAVLLNLASVGAAVGVMALVCRIPAGYPLGGHPYVDTVGAAGIFGITFGLSIDYAVFLIARMRERYERDGDNRAAVAFGLEKTAGVITGAAAIMAAVFVSFAVAPIATVSQMGVGLTVAILLDATVVRIVLLPALMLLIGDRVWHTPAWMARLLPDLNVHGAGSGSTQRPGEETA